MALQMGGIVSTETNLAPCMVPCNKNKFSSNYDLKEMALQTGSNKHLLGQIQCYPFITYLVMIRIWIKHSHAVAPKFFNHGLEQKNYRK